MHLLSTAGEPLSVYPVVDEAWHWHWARMVAEGDLLAYAPFFRAPLYPWALGLHFALAGSHPVSGALLSVVLAAAGVCVMHRTARMLTGRWWALGAALLWALWGPSVLYSTRMLMVTLFVALLVGSLHLLLSGRERSGWLLLGLACATRPTALLLLPAAWAAGARPRLPKAALVLLPVAVVWACNAMSGDPLTLISSQGGVNLYIGNSRAADGFTAFAPLPAGPEAGLPGREGLPYVDNVHAASRAAHPDMERESAVSAAWVSRTVGEVAEAPLEWAGLMGRKAAFLLSPVEVPGNQDVYYWRRLSPVVAALVSGPVPGLPWLLLLAVLPVAAAAGPWSREQRILLAWSLLLALPVLLFFVTSRLRLPVVPFLLLLAAARLPRAKPRAWLLAPAGAAAGLALALLTSHTVPMGGVNMPFHNACAHMESGELERARQLYLQALERAEARQDLDMCGTDALYDLGVLEARRGDLEAAVEWWELLLVRSPGHPGAMRALQVVESLDPAEGGQ